jgi:hypothetical protein
LTGDVKLSLGQHGYVKREFSSSLAEQVSVIQRIESGQLLYSIHGMACRDCRLKDKAQHDRFRILGVGLDVEVVERLLDPLTLRTKVIRAYIEFSEDEVTL